MTYRNSVSATVILRPYFVTTAIFFG
jgi:hypothetical protein